MSMTMPQSRGVAGATTSDFFASNPFASAYAESSSSGASAMDAPPVEAEQEESMYAHITARVNTRRGRDEFTDPRQRLLSDILKQQRSVGALPPPDESIKDGDVLGVKLDPDRLQSRGGARSHFLSSVTVGEERPTAIDEDSFLKVQYIAVTGRGTSPSRARRRQRQQAAPPAVGGGNKVSPRRVHRPLVAGNPIAVKRGGSSSPAPPVEDEADAPIILRNPADVPLSQYVHAQLKALRYSMQHDLDYHTQFMDHGDRVKAAVVDETTARRRAWTFDYVEANRLTVAGMTPHVFAQQRAKRAALVIQRRGVTDAALPDWMERVASEKQKLSAVFDDRSASLGRSGVERTRAIHSTTAERSDDDLEDDVETLRVKKLITLCIHAAVARKCYAVVDEYHWQLTKARRARDEAVVSVGGGMSLQQIHRSWATVRRSLRAYIRRYKMRRYAAPTELVRRFLVHHRRMQAIIAAAGKFRSAVIKCQRTVRTFLAARAARVTLLTLQWLAREADMMNSTHPLARAKAVARRSWQQQESGRSVGSKPLVPPQLDLPLQRTPQPHATTSDVDTARPHEQDQQPSLTLEVNTAAAVGHFDLAASQERHHHLAASTASDTGRQLQRTPTAVVPSLQLPAGGHGASIGPGAGVEHRRPSATTASTPRVTSPMVATHSAADMIHRSAASSTSRGDPNVAVKAMPSDNLAQALGTLALPQAWSVPPEAALPPTTPLSTFYRVRRMRYAQNPSPADYQILETDWAVPGGTSLAERRATVASCVTDMIRRRLREVQRFEHRKRFYDAQYANYLTLSAKHVEVEPPKEPKYPQRREFFLEEVLLLSIIRRAQAHSAATAATSDAAGAATVKFKEPPALQPVTPNDSEAPRHSDSATSAPSAHQLRAGASKRVTVSALVPTPSSGTSFTGKGAPLSPQTPRRRRSTKANYTSPISSPRNMSVSMSSSPRAGARPNRQLSTSFGERLDSIVIGSDDGVTADTPQSASTPTRKPRAPALPVVAPRGDSFYASVMHRKGDVEKMRAFLQHDDRTGKKIVTKYSELRRPSHRVAPSTEALKQHGEEQERIAAEAAFTTPVLQRRGLAVTDADAPMPEGWRQVAMKTVPAPPQAGPLRVASSPRGVPQKPSTVTASVVVTRHTSSSHGARPPVATAFSHQQHASARWGLLPLVPFAERAVEPPTPTLQFLVDLTTAHEAKHRPRSRV